MAAPDCMLVEENSGSPPDSSNAPGAASGGNSAPQGRTRGNYRGFLPRRCRADLDTLADSGAGLLYAAPLAGRQRSGLLLLALVLGAAYVYSRRRSS